MVLKLGVDGGNNGGKVVGEHGYLTFNTSLCQWFERDVEETFGSDDMDFTIDGKKGLAGTIAAHENEYGVSNMYGTSKAHDDAKVRVILGVYRYIKRYAPEEREVYIVTGQPIGTHKPAEKTAIKNMLEGVHQVTVNNEHLELRILGVGIAPEGSAAFWGHPQEGTVRILDIGSGTVNAATIRDKHHINTGSGTFNFGIETIRNKEDLEGMAHGIITNTTRLKWDKRDQVLVCGGISEKIAPLIATHYPAADILKPYHKSRQGVRVLHPVYANAVGFYELAKGAF